MKRHVKPLVVVVALALSLVLTITHHGRVGVGDPLAAAPPPITSRAGKRPYDLGALRIFNATLMRVNDAYVDPTRVDPKQMLLAALDQVQKSVAEVLVEPHAAENRVVVRVDTAQREFGIGEVDSPWALSLKMREIFRFIEANLQSTSEPKDLEYAATNGMLSTLDPHSVLLDPTIYNEMRLNTSGHFGGLGIVISIRKGALTVLKTMPGTPAASAGIKAGDRILRIEKESTVNMMLSDAVNRLRGQPDTKVEVWIERDRQPARRLVLTRAVIQVKTVEAHALKNNIGYIKLSQFSGNSAEELRHTLDELRGKGMRGIVLDLRGDPGGLLDQAIKVADEFVESGTLVTTVGYANKQREEKRATPGNQPHVPMVVLVDGGSASASEIVAGALKNLDRAIVIGSRTFGKGSVQVLYDNDDGSALKLTIAQYLTPGDVSIQSTGIIPDIAIEPAVLTKDRVSVFRPSHNLREQDLDAHLTSRNAQAGERPMLTVRYLSDQPKKKPPSELLRDDDKPGDEPEGDVPDDDLPADSERFTEDFDIIFARELLGQAKGWKRHEILASSRGFFDKKIAEERAKMADALKKFGVDWASAEESGREGTAQLAAQLATDRPHNEVGAGDTIVLTGTVTNRGVTTAWQVRGITHCDDPFLADREFMFGRLAPGETRAWNVPVKVDRAALSRLESVRLEVSEERGAKARSEALDVKIVGLPRPRFAYSYQLIDDLRGNGDGLVQRGEEARLHVVVKNIGQGKSYKTLATLSNKSGVGVDVGKGRFQVDNLAPGESKAVDFTFTVSDYKSDTFTLEMDVFDQVLHEFVSDKLAFSVSPNRGGTEVASGEVTVTVDQAEVRSGAASVSPIIGYAPRGASFRLTGRTSDFYRVEIETGRPAFLALATARSLTPPGQGSVSRASFAPSMQVVPPRLALDNAPLAVDGPSVHLTGSITDERQLADVYVFISNRGAKIEHRKVFYRSNRKASTPKSMRLDAEIPLWPGINQVTVVARQSNQVQSQQTLIVQRRGTPSQQAAK